MSCFDVCFSIDDRDYRCKGEMTDGDPGHTHPKWDCGGCPPSGPELEDVDVWDVTEEDRDPGFWRWLSFKVRGLDGIGRRYLGAMPDLGEFFYDVLCEEALDSIADREESAAENRADAMLSRMRGE